MKETMDKIPMSIPLISKLPDGFIDTLGEMSLELDSVRIKRRVSFHGRGRHGFYEGGGYRRRDHRALAAFARHEVPKFHMYEL